MKQKRGVTRKKEEKGKIKGKTETNRERKEKRKGKNKELVRQASPIGYFPLSLSKSFPLPKAKKGVPLGTNHSGSLPSK